MTSGGAGLPVTGPPPRGALAAAWLEAWLNGRNRLISNPKFQSWAARAPFVRGIARRRARALFDICAGFVYSQTLLACVRTGLFPILEQGPTGIGAIAAQTGIPVAGASRLLRAAVSLRLVSELGDGRFALGELGAALVGAPGLAEMIEHHAVVYRDLADPVGLLRGERATELGRFWPYAGDRPGDGSAGAPEDASAPYSALMSATQPLVAEDIIGSYPFRRHRGMLDVGGGEGAFLAAVGARAPRLRLHLFDLPPVAHRGRQRLRDLGFAGRTEATGGSFLNDPLPRGADLITLIRVLHDHDDESSSALLRRAHEALPPGGRLLIAEPMAGARGAEPVGDAYFGFYLLAMGRGRARTQAEIAHLVGAAGFADVRPVATPRPLLASAVVALRT